MPGVSNPNLRDHIKSTQDEKANEFNAKNHSEDNKNFDSREKVLENDLEGGDCNEGFESFGAKPNNEDKKKKNDPFLDFFKSWLRMHQSRYFVCLALA